MKIAMPFLTLGQAARALGVDLWQVQRVCDRGLFKAPARIGRNRVIARGDLGHLKKVLRQVGYLHRGRPRRAA